MPIIPYTASNFSRHWGVQLTGHHDLSITWNELVWAAMTMGKPGIEYLFSHGWHSISDLIVRSHIVYANLCENSDRIEKSSLYAGLDPTEKSGVSYFMGMLAAKVMAYRLLEVPWLFHLSMIDGLGGNLVLKGKSEPDLIGLRTNREWIVAEAKGRTWGYNKSAMVAAKLQTRQLRQINGQYPSLRVAIQASFGHSLNWAIEDPEGFDETARDLQFDVENILAMYYSASILATDGGQERVFGDRKFLIRELPEIGVIMGMDQEVLARLKERTMFQTFHVEEAGPVSKPQQNAEFTIFADGLVIALDERWSDNRMSHEPWLRRNL